MLLLIQLTTFLSLLSFALAACNQASIKLDSNEELPNVSALAHLHRLCFGLYCPTKSTQITDVRYTHTARINGASNGLDANGVVGSRVYGNLSPFENITAFCDNEYSGTRNASTTLGGECYRACVTRQAKISDLLARYSSQDVTVPTRETAGGEELGSGALATESGT